MVDEAMKQLNTKGLRKWRALTSLIKEYKLKNFIKKEKTKHLFQEIYQ